MKRTVLASLFLLSLAAVPLHAIQITSVDDVIRMHRAGVGDELLLAIAQTPHDFAVTAEDIAAMEDAGVPQAVIEAVVATAGANAEAALAADTPRAEPASAEAEETTASLSGDWCITFDPPFPLFWPDYAVIARWIWDPWWFMPRLDGEAGKATPATAGSSNPAPAERPRVEVTRKERSNGDDSRLASFAEALRGMISRRPGRR